MNEGYAAALAPSSEHLPEARTSASTRVNNAQELSNPHL